MDDDSGECGCMTQKMDSHDPHDNNSLESLHSICVWQCWDTTPKPFASLNQKLITSDISKHMHAVRTSQT